MNIAETHQFLEYEVKSVRGNQRLKPEAARADLARAYRKARDRAAELFNEAEAAAEKQRRVLRRKAFISARSTGGSDAISRRDAADRAAMVDDPAEAARILRRAEDHGDEDLAAAVAEVAYDKAQFVAGVSKSGKNPWKAVLAEYVADRPAVLAAINELSQVPDFTSIDSRLRLAAQYSVPKPTEIADLSDAQIDMLADSED